MKLCYLKATNDDERKGQPEIIGGGGGGCSNVYTHYLSHLGMCLTTVVAFIRAVVQSHYCSQIS